MTRTVWVSLPLVAALTLLAGVPPSSASHGPLTLYDDFSGLLLNPDKWDSLEGLRSAVGRYEVRSRLAGPSSTDLRRDLRFPEAIANNIWSIQAVVRVLNASLTGPATSNDLVAAEIQGAFYNDGRTSGASGDQTGEVFGRIRIRKTGDADALRVTGRAFVCDNTDCTVSRRCFSPDFDLGTVGRGVPVTLLLEWDGTKFVFKRATQRAVAFQPPASGIASSVACVNQGRASNLKFKALRSRVSVPTDGVVGEIRATFDNVRVFQAAAAPYRSYPYYYGASLFGPVRPLWAILSLALVVGVLVSQAASGLGTRGRRWLVAGAVLGGALLAFAAPGQAHHLPLSRYDEFSGTRLDLATPTAPYGRWSPYDIEFERRVQGGRFLSSLRTPRGFQFFNNLVFPYEQVGQLDTMRAKVRVLRATGGQFPANPYFLESADGPRAGLAGLFFNDGRRTGRSGDQTGDVLAEVSVRNHPRGGLMVGVLALVCDNPGCTRFRTCFATPFPEEPPLGRVRIGQETTLELDWNGTTFTFKRDARPPVTYTPPTAGSAATTACFRPIPTPTPNVKFKALRTRVNLTSPYTPSSAEGTVVALFDDVFVYLNPAYPYGGYFGASLMGPARPVFAWASLALVGGLVLSQLARRRPRRLGGGRLGEER